MDDQEKEKEKKKPGRPKVNEWKKNRYESQKNLHLGSTGAKLVAISDITHQSQSKIVRKLINAAIENTPEIFRPTFPVFAPAKKKKKRSRRIYFGDELSDTLDAFCGNTDIKMSHLLCNLLRDELKKWPDAFKTPKN